MKLNGKRVAGGLAAAGLAAGALASGGVALASARTPAAPATWAAATAGPRAGWCPRDPGDTSGMIRMPWGQHPLTGAAAQKPAMLREMRSHLDDMVSAVPRTVPGPGRMSPAAGMGMGH